MTSISEAPVRQLVSRLSCFEQICSAADDEPSQETEAQETTNLWASQSKQ